MKFEHNLENVNIDLEGSIARHSADECAVYKRVAGEPLYLGYYFPKDYDKKKKYPLFIFIHGGGWESHQIFADQKHWQGDYLGYLARYYADKGMICVSLDYRCIREQGQIAGYELIDCYEDCCDAVDYVLTRAEEYGIDRETIYLLGESAGGHLAGAVGTFHYERRYHFKKIFLINAVTDLLDEKWSSRVPRITEHKKLKELDMEQRAMFLSPLYQMDVSTSPTILLHGGADTIVSPEHSVKFYRRMCELSKTCDIHMIKNTDHAFLLAEFTKEIQACKMGISIIDKYLEKNMKPQRCMA